MTDMAETVVIGGRPVGVGHPTYVIAEISANHHQRLDRAVELVRLAAAAGADAVKLQTYTPDTLTLDSDREPFVVEGTVWEGRRLYDLYAEAMTPWDWYGPLAEEATANGMHLFSTPFDRTAIEFLEQFEPPAYKIASFELVDLALIRAAASTGRPLIMSTGMATADEVDEAVAAARDSGAGGIVLLRCNSAYPADPAEMDLRTIPEMRSRWQVPIGLSDHTLSTTAAVAAVALGAAVLEKHVTFSRDEPGPDSSFSLEPQELRELVTVVRETEASLGGVRFGPSPSERRSLAFRRSLFVVTDLRAGDVLTEENVRSIRPGHGLAPKHLPEVLGRAVRRDVEAGTPLAWDLFG
jgi:pseudaminic acid synthase